MYSELCNALFVYRYMIAARDIKPCELILWEEPAVVGPYSKSGSIGCLQCFRKVDGKYTCSGCHFPMCNKECELSRFHKEECHFFQATDQSLQSRFSKLPNGGNGNVASNPIIERNTSNSPLWITPLRMLLKKKSDKKMFSRISMLRDHTAPKGD